MEINWPGEKLLIKLCETVGNKGIGSLLKPWQMRREGAAAAEIKRLNSLMLAQTKNEVADIQTGKKVLLPGGKLADAAVLAGSDGATASRVAIINELEAIVKANLQNEAFRKEVSVAKAVLYAEQELAHDTEEPSAAEVSDDWLLRWRDNASAISSEELQMLWGKVLAGEIKSPGAFSLRTLEFLRNISASEARLIEKIAPFVIHGAIVCTEDKNLGISDIKFDQLLELQELGIVIGVEGTGLSLKFKRAPNQESFAVALLSHERVLLIKNSDKESVLELPVIALTSLGKQVLAIGKYSANEKNLRHVGQWVKEQNYSVELAEVSYINSTPTTITSKEML
jgi:hypothetical protein